VCYAEFGWSSLRTRSRSKNDFKSTSSKISDRVRMLLMRIVVVDQLPNLCAQYFRQIHGGRKTLGFRSHKYTTTDKSLTLENYNSR